MSKGNINLPSGSGGIVRYFDKSISRIEIAPHVFIAALILLIFLLIIFHLSCSFTNGLQCF